MTRARRVHGGPLAVVGVVFAVLLQGCAFWRVDAPIILRADRRLSMVEPRNDEVVELPMTARWVAREFRPSDGSVFAIFIDRPPLGPGKRLRLRVCGEAERRPIAPGEFRLPCREDHETIKFTTSPELAIDCFDTNFALPQRTRNRHALTVVLLGADKRRIGDAAATVNFEITEQDARRCRGVSSGN